MSALAIAANYDTVNASYSGVRADLVTAEAGWYPHLGLEVAVACPQATFGTHARPVRQRQRRGADRASAPGRDVIVVRALAAASGVLIRFAVRRYLASPLYTGNPQT